MAGDSDMSDVNGGSTTTLAPSPAAASDHTMQNVPLPQNSLVVASGSNQVSAHHHGYHGYQSNPMAYAQPTTTPYQPSSVQDAIRHAEVQNLLVAARRLEEQQRQQQGQPNLHAQQQDPGASTAAPNYRFGAPQPVTGQPRAPVPTPYVQSLPTATTGYGLGSLQHYGSSSSTESGSEAGSTSSQSSNSTIGRNKRKREDEGGTGKGKEKEKEKEKEIPPTNHGLPVEAINQLHACYSSMQEQLNSISKSLLTRNEQPAPLISPDSLLQQVLQGFTETNEILREGFRARTDPSKVAKPSGWVGDGDYTSNQEDLRPAKRRKGQLEPMTRGDDKNRLARVVRNFFREVFMGSLDPDVLSSPTLHECTIDNFLLDLTKPPGSAYNKSAKKVFLSAIFDRNIPELTALQPSKSAVEKLFISNFRTERAAFAWSMKKLEHGGKEGERDSKLQYHRRRERKRWLYFRRIKAARRYKETHRHVAMLRTYGVDGMSTDESVHDNGTGRPIYRIHCKRWRHPQATHCLRIFDALHRDSRFRPIRKTRPGAHAHNRVLSGIPSANPPPAGLPSALYCQDWLDRQNDVVKESLDIIESEPYDFSHNAYIEQLADVNNGKLDTIYGYA
ncbi:hypothetical protein DFP72DRAFT_495694 [Ephemerocybe angulata]|uniref:Uncharacterized protein n=1 Tax=Ephemerocybe angulata TaxID=980116 RepID=A0A8H6M2Y4_9AGAR|nr:hypothetical protein DFP72DRAFT_495694 [Tulosesus angulatus]